MLQEVTTAWRNEPTEVPFEEGVGLEWTAFFLMNRARGFVPPGKPGVVYLRALAQTELEVEYEHQPLHAPVQRPDLRVPAAARLKKMETSALRRAQHSRPPSRRQEARYKREKVAKQQEKVKVQKPPRVRKPLPVNAGTGQGTHWKSKPMVVCPHCKKEGLGLVMGRWHFDNCKEKP